MKIRIWLFLLCFLVAVSKCFAQNTHDDLAVAKYPEWWLPDLLLKIKSSGQDTARINDLIRISSIYNRKKLRDNSNVDSALLYAREALALSLSLHDQQGFVDATFLICKNAVQKQDLNAAILVLKIVKGEQRVRLLIIIAEHFVFLPGALSRNLDLAFPYIKEALSLSKSIHSVYWQVQSQNILAKYYYSRGQFNLGKQQYQEIIALYHKRGDLRSEAHWWSELGVYMPDNDSTYRQQIQNQMHALVIFHKLHMVREEANELMNLSAVNKLHNQLDKAIDEVVQAVTLLKSIGDFRLYSHYDQLAEMYQDKGDLDRALSYAFLGYKNSIRFKTSPGWYAKAIGNVYRQMGEAENSIKYYKIALTDLSFPNIGYRFMVVRYVAEAYISLHRPQTALDFTRRTIAGDPPDNVKNREIIAATLAQSYQGLHATALAEHYYREMIRLDEIVQKDRVKQIFYDFRSIDGAEAYYLISRFYAVQHKFDLTAFYLSKATTFSNIPIVLKKNMANVQGKIDSAAGNYLGALVHFQHEAAMKDSIFSLARDKELQELRLRFETSEKEKDMALLHKDLQLQTEAVAKSAQARKFTYAGILMLLILLGVIFNRYRLKLRSNRLLEEQKDIITQKNNVLTQLVTEKEWLIKEVHHRVKNNLQIVMTLLNGPIRDQPDDRSNSAMVESLRRVQAMSMLHQRLYLQDSSANVGMRPYLHELIANLKDSFGSGNLVLFRTEIDDIELDMVQAVPVGLIFNEAITNALKYAFPEKTEGQIEITLTQLEGKVIRAAIKDNGVGLPEIFDIHTLDSFGLKLISGLSEELDGHLVISGVKGTSVMIEFEKFMVRDVDREPKQY